MSFTETRGILRLFETTLLEDVRESAFGKLGMHRDNGSKQLIAGALF